MPNFIVSTPNGGTSYTMSKTYTEVFSKLKDLTKPSFLGTNLLIQNPYKHRIDHITCI